MVEYYVQQAYVSSISQIVVWKLIVIKDINIFNYLQNSNMGIETDAVTSRPGEDSHPSPTEPCSVTGTACQVFKSPRL